jgi:predicted secreted protein
MTLLLAALLIASDPAVASQQSQAPAPVPAEAAKPEKEKKICRVDTNDSSSRLRKRVCMTQTEWDRKAAGESANDLKNKGAR